MGREANGITTGFRFLAKTEPRGARPVAARSSPGTRNLLSALCPCRVSQPTSSRGVLARMDVCILDRDGKRSQAVGDWASVSRGPALARQSAGCQTTTGRRPAVKSSGINVRRAWCVVKSARSRPVTAPMICFGGKGRPPPTTKWLVIGSGSTSRSARTTARLRRTNGWPAILTCFTRAFSVMSSPPAFLCSLSERLPPRDYRCGPTAPRSRRCRQTPLSARTALRWRARRGPARRSARR